MFDKTADTWSLMRASWEVLKSNKGLLLFPLFSAIGMLIIVGTFISSYWWAHALWPISFGQDAPPSDDTDKNLSAMGYLILFVFYFLTYAITSFFNSGLAFCALAHLRGEKATVTEGFRQAFKRIHLIINWAFVAASVGVILKFIAERSNLIGKIVSGIFGVAFSLASFFVIPIMVAEEKGPIAALKESSVLFTKTWGKNIKGNLGFSAVFLLLWLPAIILIPAIILGFHQSVTIMSLGIGLVVSYMIILIMGQTTLQAIYQVALYQYSKTGAAPAGYDKDLLQSAVEVK